jgi:hypothetical protein
LGVGFTVATICGNDFSMLSVTLLLAEFPATSTAVPLTFWFAPSVVTTCGDGQVAIPESLSLQIKLTVTEELFQPAPLGTGEETAVMTGATLSTLTVTLAEAVLPASSVALPGITWPLPLLFTLTGVEQETIADKLALQVKVTVTGPLFHPEAFGAGETAAEIRGNDFSMFSVTWVVAVFPA